MPISSLATRINGLKPLSGNLLVRRLDPDAKRGLLHLPANQIKTGLDKGTVLAKGCNVTDMEIGDIVLFPCQLGFNRAQLPDGQAEVIPANVIVAKLTAKLTA